MSQVSLSANMKDLLLNCAPGVLPSPQPEPVPPLYAAPTRQYGISLIRVSHERNARITGTPSNPLVGFVFSALTETDHRMAGRRLIHLSGEGSVCITPAGADYDIEFKSGIEALVLEVNQECLSLAMMQAAGPRAELKGCMDDRDDSLVLLANALEQEVRSGYARGMLYWSSLAADLIRRVTQRYVSHRMLVSKRMLTAKTLQRVDAFINDNLGSAIDLNDLAEVADCELFHFARSFRQAVGVSPYRYVLRRRLERARDMIMNEKHAMSEVAASTGFVDQSHLTNWFSRVYGVSPGRFARTMPRLRRN